MDHSRRKSRHRSRSPEETNLINFSFLSHKSELNRLLQGYHYRDALIDNCNDFWLFLAKYENLLKKSGQCVLPDPMEPSDPAAYNKTFSINLRISVPFDELQARLGSGSSLSRFRLKQFLRIVEHYSDFRQKERFKKLKKLRQTQKNLPVAAYRDDIVEAVRNEQVVIIAGDTGCGKSTQVPQFLHYAGLGKIGKLGSRLFNSISCGRALLNSLRPVQTRY